MSYQVLARRWRPQTFDDVVGQEAVVRTLQRALKTERVAHAFLFCGSRGIGKTTLARLMAKALCCDTGVTASPCGECVHCREIMAGNAVDVVEIDGASNNSVDNVRDLRETARFQPQSCRFKVFIIDEVHMLSTAAFNALLKTLEEPPPHVKFIFATTEPHKIPVTILSRCQRYDFKRIGSAEIIGRLKYVLAQEDLGVDDAGLAVIARAAEGGMRDALSLTDQVLSFAGDGATAEQVAEALGLIDRRVIVRATEAVLARDAKAALDELDRCFDQGYDLLQFAEALCRELRHLNIAKACGSVRGFADLADDDLEVIDARAKKSDGKDLMRCFAAALDGLDRMGESDNEKLSLELTVLRLCERPPLTDAVAISEALVRLDALARGKPVPPLSRGPGGGGGPGNGSGGPGRAQAVVEETLRVSPPPAGTDHARADSANANADADHGQRQPMELVPPPASSDDRGRAETVSLRPPAELVQAHRTDGDRPPGTGNGTGQGALDEGPEASLSAVDEAAERAAAEDQVAAAEAGAHPTGAASAGHASQPSVAQGNGAQGNGAQGNGQADVGDDSADLDDEDEELEEDLGLELDGVDDTWLDFVLDVERRTRSMLGGALTHGIFAGVDDAPAGPRVRVAFAQPHHTERVQAALTREELKASLEVFGEGAYLEIVEVPEKPTLSVFMARRIAREKIQDALEAHAREHPTVKKALELFGGEIRAVRS